MPTVSDAIDLSGALVRVEVGISHSWRRQYFAKGRPIPQPVSLTALIDTGAEVTCIDALAARPLRSAGRRAVVPVNTPAAGGLSYQMTYELRLTVLHPSGQSADNLVLPDLLVAELPLNALGIEVLLGRDVLALCRLDYDGQRGTFALTY
ncbi:MAG: hypothetical protein U0746_18900 [Gemmataceae bacterium]